MDVLLTEEELQREKDLFEAQQEAYKPLEGRKQKGKDVDQVGRGDRDRAK